MNGWALQRGKKRFTCGNDPSSTHSVIMLALKNAPPLSVGKGYRKVSSKVGFMRRTSFRIQYHLPDAQRGKSYMRYGLEGGLLPLEGQVTPFRHWATGVKWPWASYFLSASACVFIIQCCLAYPIKMA